MFKLVWLSGHILYLAEATYRAHHRLANIRDGVNRMAVWHIFCWFKSGESAENTAKALIFIVCKENKPLRIVKVFNIS